MLQNSGGRVALCTRERRAATHFLFLGTMDSDKSLVRSMKRSLKIVGWFLVGLFGLAAFGALLSGRMMGYLGCGLCAAAAMPLLYRWTKRFGTPKNVAGRIIAVLMAIVIIGASTPSKSPTVQATTQPSPAVPQVAQLSSKPVESPRPVPKGWKESPSSSPTPMAEKPWKEYLPQEDQGLRSQLAANAFVEGWLQGQDAWVGYATTEYLLGQGFFVNTVPNHDGQGQEPDITNPRGSCSVLSQTGRIPAVMCGKSATTWQWGIQSDEARRNVMAIMEPEVYEERQSQTPQPDQTEFNAEIFDPPSNCRSDAGKEYSVVTTFPRGVVAVEANSPKTNEGNWYREIHQNCWIHESQLRWLGVAPSPQEDEVYAERPQTVIVQPPAQVVGSTSSSSGRCNSPTDRDIRGNACGGRASSHRSGKRVRRR